MTRRQPTDTGASPRPASVIVGTPAKRDRYVDFLRVLAIAMVVLGHWLVTSVIYQNGGFAAADVLGAIHWARWVTLAFQVVPVFFLAGGYAAASSWTRHREQGRGAYTWLRQRSYRLLVPTTLYIGAATLVVATCIAARVQSATLSLAGWAVALHLWFLPVYLALLLLTPALHAAHRRWGLAVPALMACAAVGVDTAVHAFHATWLGWLNYLLVWGAVYQMGFAWQDRTLVRPRLLAGLVAFGILAFTGLTWLGPYPVSMIGEPGAHVKNTSPPSAALLAYECAQTGLLVIIAPAVSRRLAGPVAGRAVDRANRVVMTVFLWHMAPVAILGSVLYATGALPQPAAGSIEWWVLRPVWIAALTAVLIPLVFALSRLEARLVRHLPTLADPDGLAGPFALPVLCAGIVLAGFALYRFAVAGFAPDGRLPVLALVSFVVGVLLVVALPRGPAR